MVKNAGSNDASPPVDPADGEAGVVGKGHATPARKDREAANRRPIGVADRKEAKPRLREQERTERATAQAGYAAGDEKFLPLRDRGPQKKWVRDYVDARLSAGELLIPLMFLVIILLYVPFEAAQAYSTVAMIGFFGLVIVDSVYLAWRTQKRINEKFGARAEKVRSYAVMRALQLRMMRLPKPKVKRFNFPE